MMEYSTPMSRRAAARILMGSMTVVGLESPAEAHSTESFQEKAEAARVAKKVEKAKSKKHEAKEELEAIDHFQKQVAKYVRIHEGELARLSKQPPVTSKALAEAIVAERAKAKQGDVFLPDVQPLFKRLIAEQLVGPDTQAARKAVAEGNPADDEDSVPVAPKVNLVYPSGASRSTVPPSLLMVLPHLPESVHYRFVNRDLLLVDSVAQLIVDFIPAAMPTPGAK